MPTALITGATSGIGAAYARHLGAAGHDLVLVARDRDRLAGTAAQLRSSYGLTVETLPADLADHGQCGFVEQRLDDRTRPVALLVNNAGFGMRTAFVDSDIADEERMLDVLVRAVLRLSHAAARSMTSAGGGAIVNVASVAGFRPDGSYSAAKAWVIGFSEGLALELAGSGVRVQALCPGFTRTEFHQRADIGVATIPRWLWLQADDVVAASLRDLRRGRVRCVPGAQYRVIAGLMRLAPGRLVGPASRRIRRR